MKVFVMVGNIGTGKSTYVTKFLKSHPETVVISRGALRYMIGAGKYIFNPELEPFIFEAARLMIKNLMHEELVDILIDEVNVSTEYREDYLTLAKQYAYESVAIVMPKLVKSVSVDRRMQDPHGQDNRVLWESVWDKFNSYYEEPTKKEGFDKIIFIKEKE